MFTIASVTHHRDLDDRCHMAPDQTARPQRQRHHDGRQQAARAGRGNWDDGQPPQGVGLEQLIGAKSQCAPLAAS